MPDPTTKPSTGTAAAGAAASGGKAGASGGAYGANSVSLRVLTLPWCTSAGSDRTEFAWRGGVGGVMKLIMEVFFFFF